MQISSEHKEEALFFLVGVLPYWYTLWLPEKNTAYWCVLVWACSMWIVYGIRKRARMTVLNNIVELTIAVSGIYYILTKM